MILKWTAVFVVAAIALAGAFTIATAVTPFLPVWSIPIAFLGICAIPWLNR